MCFKHLGFFVVFLQLFRVWLTFLLYSMPFILIHNLPRILMNFTEGNTSIQKQRAENGSWLPRKYLNRWSYFSFYVECRNNDEIKIVMQNACECVGLFIVATPVKPMQRRDWCTSRLFRFQFLNTKFKDVFSVVCNFKLLPKCLDRWHRSLVWQMFWLYLCTLHKYQITHTDGIKHHISLVK